MMSELEMSLAKKARFDIKSIFPFLGLVFVLAFFGIMSEGALFSEKSVNSMLNDGIYILVGAIGYMFILSQGELDFSIGAVMAVACATGCIAANVDPYLALPVGVVSGAAVGLVNSLVIVKLGVNSFITTLAMQYVCNGLVLVILGEGILGAPMVMLDWFTTPFKITLIAVAVVVGFFVFEHTYYGKMAKALGASKEAVRQSGANVVLLRMAPFIVIGGVMGLLGFVSLTRTGSASSTTGSSVMINVLNALLIGGLPFSGGTTSKFRSALVGTVTITAMTCGMTILGTSTVNQQLIKGLVFLVAISLSFDRRNLKVIK
jgi:ribose transport system permease protein